MESYFGTSTPELLKVAFCESSLQQFDKNGNPLLSKTDDIGVFQISAPNHALEAEKMNINLNTLDGNVKFAKWLYDTQGIGAWDSSRKCWENLTMKQLEANLGLAGVT